MALLDHLTADNASPCLIFPDRVWSYGEVCAAAETIARRLPAARSLIALEASPSADFIITYIAALKGGHVMALLPPGDADAADVFHRDFRPDLSCQMHGGQWGMVTHGGPSCALHPDLSIMLATSGSEGAPRWVRLSRGNIEANASSIVAYLNLSAADRVPHTLPFHYCYGLSILNTHLAAGGSIAFCGESVIEPDFLTNAARLGCTGFAGVPFTYELLERLNARDALWPELCYMTVAGGRMPPALVTLYDRAMRQKGGDFFVMYGQTEATARMAYVPSALLADHADCIGVAIPGGSFRICDDKGNSVRGPGELFYSGPNVMMGYATSRADLARGAELAELATGDIASKTPDGLLRIEGRASRFSKIAGLRIGHEAIEWALRSSGAACAVTGDDEAISIHVEGTAAAELHALAAEAAGIPPRFIRLRSHEALPRLASGKIDYKRLGQAAAPVEPQDGAQLVDDFRAAFYPRTVTPRDSFDALECDSLAYVQVSLAIERHLGFLPEGWEGMPVERLEKLRPAATAKAGWLSRIESHVVLRAAAILLIVVHHATLWPLPGGAAALMLMVGYGFARFHREQLFGGRSGAFLLPMLRNMLPYFVVAAGFAVAWEQVPWASLFLIGNLGFADPARHSMLPFQFWFVEAYVQLCLLAAAAFAVPGFRRGVARRPFESALLLVVIAFGLRYAVPLVYDIGNRKIFTLTYVLWLPALGWCAYFAQSPRQRVMLLLVAGILCPLAAFTGGNWAGAWILYMTQWAVLCVLLLLPHVSLPRMAVPVVMLIAAASYHIYLFHRIVPEVLGLDGMGRFGPLASIVVGLVCGIGAMSLQRRIFTAGGERRAEVKQAS